VVTVEKALKVQARTAGPVMAQFEKFSEAYV